MFRSRRMVFWLTALMLLGLAACDDREKGATSAGSSAKPRKAASPVAAPKGLLALARVREASKTFARVRGLVAAGAESWSKNLDGMVVRAGIVPLTAMTLSLIHI